MKKTLAIVLGAALGLGLMAPAYAHGGGQWRLNPRYCADIREDVRDRWEERRDSRRDYGRYDRAEDRFDRRENRRDSRITVCSKRAFVYVGDRGDRRYGRHKPRLQLYYDRRLGMNYTLVTGRKIYVRG
jgi:hypothetical protein